MDKKQFAEFVNGIYEYYGRNPPSEKVLHLWFADLKEFKVEQLDKAFMKYRRGDGKFMPNSGNIRSFLSRKIKQL